MNKIDQLQAARLKSGKTQAQAAEMLKISEVAYQRYEYGSGAKTIRTAIRIAKLYGSTVEDLWGGNPDEDFNTATIKKS